MRRQVETGEQPKRAVRDKAATRQRLLDAARALFGEHGYDQVTVRMIAAAAGVNLALVNRYFGSKAALFGEVLAGESALGQVIAGDPDELPRRLADHVVRQLYEGPASPVLRGLGRSSAVDPEVREILHRHVEKVLIEPLAAALPGPRPRIRAAAAAMIMLGVGPSRRLLALPDPHDLDRADRDELRARLAAMFAAALAG